MTSSFSSTMFPTISPASFGRLSRRGDPGRGPMSMLTRCILAQWPAGEARDLSPINVQLPDNSVGRNQVPGYTMLQAVAQGYATLQENPHQYMERWVRTPKACKMPKTAASRGGVFPVSQEVHQCLLWGHPVWEHLRWIRRLNKTPEAVGMEQLLAPYSRLGRTFGELRWAVGNYLSKGGSFPRRLLQIYGTDLTVMCGMLRLGVNTSGELVLMDAQRSLDLIMSQVSRSGLMDRIKTETAP
jgi:hypothetical protein